MENKRWKGRPALPEEEHTFCVTYSVSRQLLKWLDDYTRQHKEEYNSRSAVITAALVLFKKAKEKAGEE